MEISQAGINIIIKTDDEFDPMLNSSFLKVLLSVQNPLDKSIARCQFDVPFTKAALESLREIVRNGPVAIYGGTDCKKVSGSLVGVAPKSGILTLSSDCPKNQPEEWFLGRLSNSDEVIVKGAYNSILDKRGNLCLGEIEDEALVRSSMIGTKSTTNRYGQLLEGVMTWEAYRNERENSGFYVFDDWVQPAYRVGPEVPSDAEFFKLESDAWTFLKHVREGRC